MTITFQSTLVASNIRIDCCSHLGGDVVMAATRSPQPGLILRTDNLRHWKHVATVGTVGITAIANAGSGVVYIVDENSKLWKSTDYGDTWSDLGTVSNSTPTSGYPLCYGLAVTASGTLLVSDTRSGGGKIWRSINGGTSFTDLGVVGTAGLYAFAIDGTTILCPSFDGKLYKSTDDGATWTATALAAGTNAWGTAVVSSGVWCVGCEDGEVYRTTDSGANWTNVETLAAAVDSMISDGTRVLAFTYTSTKPMYQSDDGGVTWASIGVLGTQTGDFPERGVVVNGEFISGTNKGFIVYSDSTIDLTFSRRKTISDITDIAGFYDGTSSTLFDATSGGSTPAAAGTIARWQDQSGNSRHATQSTALQRPTRQTSVVGGRDVVRFDGTNDNIGFGSSDVWRNISAGLLCTVRLCSANPTSARYLVDIRNNAGTAVRALQETGRTSGKANSGGRRTDTDTFATIASSASVSTSLFQIHVSEFDFANSDIRQYINGSLDGVDTSFQTSGSTDDTASASVSFGGANNGTAPHQGDVAAIVIAHSITSRIEIEGILAWDYGLAWALPSDHTYKYEPPRFSAVIRRQCPQCLGVGVI